MCVYDCMFSPWRWPQMPTGRRTSTQTQTSPLVSTIVLYMGFYSWTPWNTEGIAPEINRTPTFYTCRMSAKAFFMDRGEFQWSEICEFSDRHWAVNRDIFIRGARGALPPLNFDNPKRSKIWYVACGTIILNAKCESSAIDFLDIF